MKSSEIRKAFIDYFISKGHKAVPSSPLVPANDPSLLFTNAGMVQFKETFLGLEKRSYQRAVSAQRCVRAGGKHNDLENVGYTARHHTFFEMLGNFSFGDYFKREAIRYAWEFLTQVLHLPPEKLWVTVYQDDDEAADIWLKELQVSPERFSRCGEKDNFWSMGDTGPCGPCTEIFYDHGPQIPGGPPGSPDADGDRYIEIWNLVFMQYNRDKEGHLHPLPAPSVDTGMGLERVAAVAQGVHNNYDIDSFQQLIQAIQKLNPAIQMNHPSTRVIADHIRACAFLIVDGVTPSNEGRGYVLRRIIRRAIRHGHKIGLPSPFFALLVAPLTEIMGDAYPELSATQPQIERILNQEEHQFSRTLDQGLRLLQEHIAHLDTKIIAGDLAFKLYDTYGFPFDLTQDIAREQGLSVDAEGFEVCMQQQREQSQSASQFSIDYHQTCAIDEGSVFHGYEQHALPSSRILAIITDNNKVAKLVQGKKGGVVLDHTPFYAESGGQVGDQGYIVTEQARFKVEDTQRHGQAIIHYGYLERGELHVQDQVEASIDQQRRSAIRLNHTATHLLHAALKQVLGPHIQQKGSLVDAERARFDFSHFEALTANEIDQIENLVNAKIRANQIVDTVLMPIEKARETGAVALFGEKYGDEVRVLSIGDFSKELCGGTHVSQTGDIGLFKIIAEYGIASGIRRIEIMTGQFALAWVNKQLKIYTDLAVQLKTSPDKINEKIVQLTQETKQQAKEIQRMQMKLAHQAGQDLKNDIEQLGQVRLLIKQLDQVDNQTLRTTLDQLKSSLENAVIILYVIQEDKINVITGVSKNLIGQVPPAAEYVRIICGKGGGRDDMAQGGGPLPTDLSAKIDAIRALFTQ